MATSSAAVPQTSAWTCTGSRACGASSRATLAVTSASAALAAASAPEGARPAPDVPTRNSAVASYLAGRCRSAWSSASISTSSATVACAWRTSRARGKARPSALNGSTTRSCRARR